MKWIYKLFNEKMKGGRDRELPFKPGSIVSVKHELFSDPVISIIQETDENYIYMAYPGEFKGSGIKTDDDLICQVQSGNMEYVIYCRINNINLFYPMYLHLYVENISLYDNMRSDRRYLVDYDACLEAENTGEKVVMTAKNISKSGLFVSVPKRNLKSFESGGELLIRLVTNYNETVGFKARVVRTVSKGRFNEYGMKIAGIDEKNGLAYEKVLNRLEDELGSLVLSYIMNGNS